MRKRFWVFGNPNTLDRYTVIDKHGEMLSLSEYGAGVNMWAGNCLDNYMFSAFGYAWRRQCDVEKARRIEMPRILNEFRREGNLGKEIKFSSLPKELKQIIYQRFNGE
jgi:hypothetical protein